MGAAQKLTSKTICVLCVGAIDRTAAGCCQIHAHSLVSVDRLPSPARAGRSRRASAAPASPAPASARARCFPPPPTFQNIAEKKDMRSSFFGAVSSGSGHRSVGYHRPCGRRRSETKSSGRGPWDVGLCVVRVSASGEYCAECLGIFVVCLPGHHGGHMRGFSG